MLRRLPHYGILLVLLIGLQACFWWHTHRMRPYTDVVPVPPGKTALQALSFGDNESYFRVQAMMLQNFGDEYGRSVSLRYYDYSHLYQWLTLLDSLNTRSNMLPALSAYYFSQIQTKTDVRYLVNYLYAHALRDVEHDWWWLLQAIYLSMHKVEDSDLAVKVAKPLINPLVPVWAQQMVAVVYEKQGEMEDALHIMNTIQQNAPSLSDADLLYMRYFIEERIRKLDKMQHKNGNGREAQ